MLAAYGACTVPTTARMTDAMNLFRTMNRIALPALLLLLVTIAPPTIAAKASGPDLAVRSVTPPGSATLGASFTVEVSVAHRGRSAAAAIGLYLSGDRVPDRADVRLAGGGRVPAVGARPASVQVRTADGQAPGSYFVMACVDDPARIRGRSERNNCHASARPLAVTAMPVSSSQLLAAAIAAHRLSAQQALVYRVFATFGDPRLPSLYAGHDSEPDDLVMQAAAEAWPTLSAAQQAELRPFFTPPAVSGSWFSTSGSAARGAVAAGASKGSMCLQTPPSTAGWHTFAVPGGHARLSWSKTDNARIGPRCGPLRLRSRTRSGRVCTR